MAAPHDDDDDADTGPMVLEDVSGARAPASRWQAPGGRPSLPPPPAVRGGQRQPPMPLGHAPAPSPVPDIDLTVEVEQRHLERQLLLTRIGCVLLGVGVLALGTLELVGRWRRSGEVKRIAAERAEHARVRKEAESRLAARESALSAVGKKAATLESAAAVVAAAEAQKAADAKAVAEANARIASELAPHAEGRDLRVVHDGVELRLSFGDRMLFPPDRAGLTLDGFRVLYHLSKALEPTRERRFVVVGHVPARPSGAARAPKLSAAWDVAAARAAAVARFLVEDLGVAPDRVLTTVREAPAPASPQPRKPRAAARPGTRTEIVISPASG